jgi:RimJ/RimL family protein N-acetyltransferase
MTVDAEGARVVLRDGSSVLIRQVHREDAPLLRDGFLRLSTESRRLRFLSEKTHLTDAELRYFTEIDHHDHEAIGALDEATGRGLGIARYIRNAEEPTEAEVAVTVVDDWQHRGLGTELLRRLNARAREEGVLTFTALVDVENEAVVGLMRNLGADVSVTRYEPGAVDYRITPQPTDTRALQDLLRHFARRDVAPPGSLRDALHALVPARFHLRAGRSSLVDGSPVAQQDEDPREVR